MVKGTLVISLDTELAWGRIGESTNSNYYHLHRQTKSVIKRLLEVFDNYQCPVTWALVGRLLDTNWSMASKDLSKFYPGLVSQNIYSSEDLNGDGESIILFPELVDLIRNSKVDHEIASHSYNHILFGSASCNKEEEIENDIALQKNILGKWSIVPKTIVYPRNNIGAIKNLQENGYTVYRGEQSTWYENMPSIFKKVARQIDEVFPIAPNLVEPTLCDGWYSLPSSMIFRNRSVGLKRHIPFSVLEKKACDGVKAAAASGKTLHLYFHPFNFAHEEDLHFSILESVLSAARHECEAGRLDILPMDRAVLKYIPSAKL